MTNDNKDICEILQFTNRLNNDYCNIFNGIMHQKINQKQDYPKILDYLSELDSHLDQATKNLSQIHISSDEVLRVVNSMRDFQKLLKIRIGSLRNVTNNLYNKSEAVGKYSFFSYRSDIKNLEQLEKQSTMIGGKLQICAVPFINKYGNY